MRYVSTRGAAPALGFEQVLLAGLASDGGLYVPEIFPILPPPDGGGRETYGAAVSRTGEGNPPSPEALSHSAKSLASPIGGRDYLDIAQTVMAPFIGDALTAPDFAACIAAAYAGFTDPAIAPLRQLDERLWLMELFHGPTLAFKDVALQLLGQLYSHVLARSGRRVTIVGATSGDTGSAAIDAFAGSPYADIFIMMPLGRVSEVQRRQMTTVDAPNVHVIGIDGSFDDCQDLVKALFADQPFRDRVALSAVNSINWARIMAQIVYYVTAAARLKDRRIAFAVPTGNFGNAYAGHVARRMGVTMEPLIVASNANDVLTRALTTGRIELRAVVPTLSPAMDIQVSSNFERYLYELYDGDGAQLGADMLALRKNSSLTLSPERLARAQADFTATSVADSDTLRTIGETYKRTGIIVDPHTAIAIKAAEDSDLPPEVAIVALASAHPSKFPEAVLEATSIHPDLPPNLADLMHKQERISHLSVNIDRLKQFILERITL